MTTPGLDTELIEDDEMIEDGSAGTGGDATGNPSSATEWRRPSLGRWILFAAIAIAVIVLDQVTKNTITGQLAPGAGMVVIPDLLNFVHGQNSGMLFGLLPQSAPAFAVVSILVTGLIVVYHAKAGRGIVTTIGLALLLGGAIGNLLDRLTHGYVVDWIDMGIGSARFWTYNVADAAITTAMIMLIVLVVFPVTANWGADD
ncbi:MAG: signal peptidase II [Chloroflexota bacterium]